MMATRHAEEQRRYRARLREKARAGADGKVAPCGAPETRAVIQALAGAVRRLAAEVLAEPDSRKRAGRVYGELLAGALDILVERGFDRTESFRRLSFYALPDRAKSRRRKAEIEERYWKQSAPDVAHRNETRESS